MASVRVEIKGSRDLARKLDRTDEIMEAGARKALGEVLVLIEGSAKNKIASGNRSGRIYKRRSVTHQASAPGEAPKTDTGSLVNHIFFRFTARLSGKVGSSKLTPYGAWLERGTSNIAKRPWLGPTEKQNRKAVQKIFKKRGKEAARRTTRV